MSEEPTIDDCASGAGGGEESGPDTDGDESRRRESTGGREGSDPDATAEPAETTYGSGSYDCAPCGSAAGRVWCGEEGLVCPDCKEW